jgi:hypothetical protein
MTLEEKVEDQLISLGQQAAEIVRLQKEVARLRDNLLASHEAAFEAEAHLTLDDKINRDLSSAGESLK